MRFAPALAVLLAVAPGSAGAAPEGGGATEELVRGQEAYDRGDFDEAMEHFETAYELDGSPVYLYPWAQAARHSGDCELAVDLYDRFLASGVEGDARKAAEQNADRCREELAAREPADPSPSPSPPPPKPPERRVDDGPPPASDNRPDAAGIVLLSAGSAAVIAGAIVLAIAEQRISAQKDVMQYGRFDELDSSIDRMQIGGGVTLGIGAALAVGGAIRLGIVSRRRRRASASATALVLSGTPAGGPLIGLSWGAAAPLSVR